MRARLPVILLVVGTTILVSGYLLVPGFALPRLIGFIILAVGFYLRSRR